MASTTSLSSLSKVSRPSKHLSQLLRSSSTATLLTVRPSQCRLLSQTSKWGAKGVMQNVPIQAPEQPSMRTRTRDITRSQLPQDLGLLPGTFIRPLWQDMPSIFRQPRERLQMEWLWLKSAFQNFVGMVAYSKYFNKGLPLRLKERRRVARELHRQMYTAFAAADVGTIRKICCTGLAQMLSTRITKRPRGEQVSWTLEKYLRTPATFFSGIRVMSDRATQIPELPNSGIRQVVVRITTRQSTSTAAVPQHGVARGSQPGASSGSPSKFKQQNCTEYIVLQKLMWSGEEDDWRIWGHANPTTLEDLDSPWFAQGLTLSERLSLMEDALRRK